MEVDKADTPIDVQIQTIRQFFVKDGINKKAAGSAYIETDKWKVTAEVFGPSITGRKLDNKDTVNITCKIETNTVESVIKEAIGDDDYVQDKENKVRLIELEETMRKIAENIILVEQYPNMEIEIWFKIFENSLVLKHYLTIALSMALIYRYKLFSMIVFNLSNLVESKQKQYCLHDLQLKLRLEIS